MMDMGVHCIDLMQYVTGSKVKQVAAFHDTLTFHYEVEDTSTVLMRLENGCECVVQSNFNIPDEASKWRLEFFGDQGHLVGENIIGQIDGGTLDAMFCGEVGGYDAQQTIDFAVAASCLKHSIEHDFNHVSVAEVAALAAGNASGRVQR